MGDVRQLYARLQPEDVVVADSAYGTYVDLVLAARRMPSFVNIMRVTAIFVGAKVRIGDHIVTWRVPNDVLSRWLQMSFKLPDTVHVREVHLLIRHLAFVPNKLFW